jgi:DNA-binding MarR family transcriptional regulator
MKTGDVIAHTTLDKMQVSRAVARLEGNGLIEREHVADDRRARVLRLTAAGRALFRRIAPLARARETFLLDALDADERRVLDRAIDKLRERARLLEQAG